MSTTIHSNGSRWGGTVCLDLSALHLALTTHTLDPTFEDVGNFVRKDGRSGSWQIWGNFFDVSHVFRITTTDAEVANRLRVLIRANQRTPAYLAAKEQRQQMQTARITEERRKTR